MNQARVIYENNLALFDKIIKAGENGTALSARQQEHTRYRKQDWVRVGIIIYKPRKNQDVGGKSKRIYILNPTGAIQKNFSQKVSYDS